MMMRNRPGNQGTGLLGEAPGQGQGGAVSRGMKRMMGGGGGDGLLGRNPNEARMKQPYQQHQHQHQQSRSLLSSPVRGGRQVPPATQRHVPPATQRQARPAGQRQHLLQGRVAGRQNVQERYQESEALLEEPVYYEEQAVVEELPYDQQYAEDPYAQQEYSEDPFAAVEANYSEQQYVEQEYVEQDPYQVDQYTNAEPYYEEDQLDAESLMEYAEQRHGMRKRNEYRIEQGSGGRQHAADTARNQRNVRGQQRDTAASQHHQGQQGGRDHLNRQQQRPARGGRPGLLESPDAHHRGRQEQKQSPRGLLETPLQPPVQPDILKQSAVQMVIKQQANTQLELMNKAELQMRLLEEEKLKEMREMEQLNLLHQQQQALLLQQQQQQQQQHLQQLQQQHLLQQQLQQQQTGILGRAPQTSMASGSIPSIFDVPTSAASAPNKRAGGPVRAVDNKKPRLGSANRNDRNRPLGIRNRGIGDNRRSLGSLRGERPRPSRFSDVSPVRKRRDSRDSSRGRDRKDSGIGRRARSSSTSHHDRDHDRRTNRDKRSHSKSEKSSPARSKVDLKVKTESVQKEEKKSMNEEYDPANPTEDVDEIKEEDKKTELTVSIGTEIKGEKKEEEKPEEKKEKQQEISLTVTVNKKGRSVNDADKTGEENRELKKKLYKCNVCAVECYDEESFARHMNGQKHRQKMNVVMMTTTHQADIIKSRLAAEEHLRQIEGSDKKKPAPTPSGKVLESHCKVCERKFTGAYKDHKESPVHKARETRSKAGCKVCNVSTFNTFQDFTKHLQSNWHKKKMKQANWPECKLCKQRFKSPRKFVQHCKSQRHIENKAKLKSEEDGKDDDDISDLVTLDTVGFEDDSQSSEVSKSSKTEEPVSDDLGSSAAPGKKTERSDSTTKLDEEDMEVPDVFDSSVVVGQKFVVAVSGYFCKLCHKFYNNETAAKITHCQSQTHFEKFKKAIVAKLKKSKEEAAANTQKENDDRSKLAETKGGDSEGQEKINIVKDDDSKRQEGMGKDANEPEDTEKEVENKLGETEKEGGSELGETMNSEKDAAREDVEKEEVHTLKEPMDDTTATPNQESETQEIFIEISKSDPAKKSTPKARRGGIAIRGQKARRGRKM